MARAVTAVTAAVKAAAPRSKVLDNRLCGYFAGGANIERSRASVAIPAPCFVNLFEPFHILALSIVMGMRNIYFLTEVCSAGHLKLGHTGVNPALDLHDILFRNKGAAHGHLRDAAKTLT